MRGVRALAGATLLALSGCCSVHADPSIATPMTSNEPQEETQSPSTREQPSTVIIDLNTEKTEPPTTPSDTAEANDQVIKPVISLEVRTGEFDGQIAWGAPSPIETKAKATTKTSIEEQEAFIERMQATLDTMLARFEEQGLTSTAHEQQTIEDLKQLIEEAAPMMTASLLQELPELYEQLVDAQTLAQDMLSQAEEDANGGLLTPSEAYLDIEDRIALEGPTQELVSALEQLAEEENDLFAHEKLAFIALFEPNTTNARDFAQAFAHLRTASDGGLSAASGTLAMLSLIDFGRPRDPSASRESRHIHATELLRDLAKEQDFMASLVVANRIMTRQMDWYLRRYDRCHQAVAYYQRCAESNVNHMAEKGGEPHYVSVRLSEEFMTAGAFTTELYEDPAQRFEYYRSIAMNPGDELWAEATERLGEMYYFGDDAAGVQHDPVRAADHFRRAADEGGEPLAQANYGMMLANGIGVQQNNKTAMEYLKRAAAQGSAFAMNGIGVLYLTGAGVEMNATRAVEYFEQAVEFGFLEAHTYLGSAYLKGTGVPKNETKAFEHFQIAASAGSHWAQFNLGVVYYRGSGVEYSCETALEYFRRVAVSPSLLTDMPFTMEKGHECYQKGDYLRAYLHYRLLSEFGSEEAQCNAAFLLERHGEVIYPSDDDGTLWMKEEEQDYRPMKEAFTLYKQAAQLNDTEAIRKVGSCYHEGWDGVCIVNYTRALEEYEMAATLGDAEAAYKCGAMYCTGDGVAQSLEDARKYFSMCSEADFPANAPCVIALAALSVISTVRNATQGILAPLWSSVSL